MVSERASPRLVDVCAERLGALARAAGFGDETEAVLKTFRRVVSPCIPIASSPARWTSEISDDHTPVELSAAITDHESDVRVLFEPQGPVPSLAASRSAGLALHEMLERELGADLDRFRIIQDLFLPEDGQGPFALWSSVVFSRGRPPAFKAYFNPQARGFARASALVEEALARLGMTRAWASLSRTITSRGPELDELKYFALDLSSEPQARIKVYVRHHGMSPEQLDLVCSGAREYVPGEAREFARSMRGGAEPMAVRAAATCSAFIEGEDESPLATTVYVPVCAYARDDLVVRNRVNEYLLAQRMDARAYNALLDAFANRPLEAGVGMQSWVAFRRQHGRKRLTVYLATETHEIHAPGSVPAPTSPPGQHDHPLIATETNGGSPCKMS